MSVEWHLCLICSWTSFCNEDTVMKQWDFFSPYTAHQHQWHARCSRSLTKLPCPKLRQGKKIQSPLHYSQKSTGCCCGQYLCRDSPFQTTCVGSLGCSSKPISSTRNSLTANPNFLMLSSLPRDTGRTNVKNKAFCPTPTPNSTPKF